MKRVTIIPSHQMTLFGPRITIFTKDGKSYTKQATGREFIWDFDEEARRIRGVAPGLPIPAAQFEQLIGDVPDPRRRAARRRARPPGCQKELTLSSRMQPVRPAKSTRERAVRSRPRLRGNRSMSKHLRWLLFVVVAFLAPRALFAQQSGQSAIAGVVEIRAARVLPGVTVEATSPALIEKSRPG